MDLEISWLGRVFGGLLQSSGQAAILVCLVLMAQFLFRKVLSPAWRYSLWLLVVVRLVWPVTVESAVSVFNLAGPFKRPVVAYKVSPQFVPQKRETPVTQPAGQIGESVRQRSQPLDESVASASGVPNSPARGPVWSSKELLFTVWLAVAVLLFARVVYKNYRFSRPVIRRRPVTDEKILNLLQDCKSEMKVVAPMDVIETDQVDTPALLGLVRPRLLLPPNMLGAFSRDHLRYFFLHELGHFKRGDNLVNWVTSILQVLHWFNPLVWLAFNRMRADREAACDALVLTRCGNTQECRRYGEAILDVAEFAARSHWLPGVVGILEDKKQMERRITMIANHKTYPAWTKAVAMSLFCALGVITLTDAQSQLPESRTTQSTDKARMSGQLVLIASSAVPPIEQALKMDLDPITGRTLLTESEAATLVDAFRKDASAFLVGEGSTEMNSGETVVIKSTQDIPYGEDNHKIRQAGWILKGTVSERKGEGVLATFGPEWCDLLGTKNVHGSPMPLFQSLNCAMTYRAPSGCYVLLRGNHAPLRNFHGVTFGDSLGAQLKDRSVDYFLLLSAGAPDDTASYIKPVPNQFMLSCSFFSLGTEAQEMLQQEAGMQMPGSPVSMTDRAYGELLKRIKKMTDTQILASGSVVTSSKEKAQTQWVQEVIFWNGKDYQTRKCGAIFDVTPNLERDSNKMDLAVAVEFTFPPEHPDPGDDFSPLAISAARTLTLSPGQTSLVSLSAPNGILPPRHRSFLAVSARVLGSEAIEQRPDTGPGGP